MPKRLAKGWYFQPPEQPQKRPLSLEMAGTLYKMAWFSRMKGTEEMGIVPNARELAEMNSLGLRITAAEGRLMRFRKWGYVLRSKKGNWRLNPNLYHLPTSAKLLLEIKRNCPKKNFGACEMQEVIKMAKSRGIRDAKKLLKMGINKEYIVMKRLEGKLLVGVGRQLDLQENYIRLISAGL